MFRLLVVPHYHFQRIVYFHTTLPAESTAWFSIGSFDAEDEFNRKARSSAPSGNTYIPVIDKMTGERK
jgi:hypothetical protein